MEPITRKERYLAYLAGDKTVVLPQPVTREERYLAAMCGMDVGLPQAVTRVDRLMDEIATQSAVSLQPLKSVTITTNGTTNVVPDEGFDGMQSVDVRVQVTHNGMNSVPFEMDSNGDYITRMLLGETSGQLTEWMVNIPGDVWLFFDFDVKVNGSFALKGAILNWNFEKFKNLIYNGTNMYFSGEIVEEIQLDRINGEWTLAKSTVENVLAKIKDAYVQSSGAEDTEIVLNRIVMCTAML